MPEISKPTHLPTCIRQMSCSPRLTPCSRRGIPSSRAAVLEAITALEAFVHKTVFGLLERTYDPLLVTWLKARTQSDFESRLFVLTPVGGTPGRQGVSAMEGLRRSQGHSEQSHPYREEGLPSRSRFVLATVRSWLAYLGSTAEVALALDGLKTYIESAGILIANEAAAERVVHQYFERTSPAVVAQPRIADGRKADLLLDYGDETVVVEIKLVRTRTGTSKVGSRRRWLRSANTSES